MTGNRWLDSDGRRGAGAAGRDGDQRYRALWLRERLRTANWG
jgi:hypothetical protein